MNLIKSVACYSGVVRQRIDEFLTNDVVDLISEIAQVPIPSVNIDASLLHELVDMDIVIIRDGLVRPHTAVFLESDLESLYDPVQKLGMDIAGIIKEKGNDLNERPPNIRNFIGSIMGCQRLHKILIDRELISSWQTKTGKYERSKVDFNQECEAYDKYGPDLQNKSVNKGDYFTSVVIGFRQDGLVNSIPQYTENIIARKDEDFFMNCIKKIGDACGDFYLSKLDYISGLMKSTIVGKQGVPVENMMMNYWRLVRRAIANKLYECGFLNDNVPINGSITIFYENGIEFFS